MSPTSPPPAVTHRELGPRPPRDLRRDTPTVTATAVFLAVAATHLAAHLATAEELRRVTQWALMPALAIALAIASRPTRPRLIRLVLVALGLSWLGDLLPAFASGDAAFLLMVGPFLLAQVVFVVAFAPYVRGGVGRHPWAALPYLAVLGVLLTIVLPHTGALAAPVVVYGVVLTAMAVLALGVDRTTAVGAAIFLVSDALIALGRFAPGYDLAHHSLVVMVTYVLGQTLIALGVLLHVRRVPVD